MVFCEAMTKHATMYDVLFAILTFSSKNETFEFFKMSFHFIAWNETFFWVHFFVYFSFIDRGHQNLILDDCAKL